MPPRKRAKASAASTPLAETQPKTPQETGLLAQSSPQNENPYNDPWSDDQETQLFKSMMKWKPTGMHKHFRMVSIHMNMHSHGYVTDDAPHTRIPGVWRKLDQLYDLRALDERENAYAFSDQPDPVDPTEAYEIPSFDLPEEDYGELIWQRRFRNSSSEASSPPFIPIEEDKALYRPGIGLLRDLPDGVRSQKAESVSGAASASASASASTPKNAKATRSSRSAAKGKAARAAQNAKNSKVQAVESESAEEEEEEEEEGDEEDEDEEESSSESAEEPAPSTRRTNRSSGRAKPAPKRVTRKKN